MKANFKLTLAAGLILLNITTLFASDECQIKLLSKGETTSVLSFLKVEINEPMVLLTADQFNDKARENCLKLFFENKDGMLLANTKIPVLLQLGAAGPTAIKLMSDLYRYGSGIKFDTNVWGNGAMDIVAYSPESNIAVNENSEINDRLRSR